jgi:hypothetical protein
MSLLSLFSKSEGKPFKKTKGGGEMPRGDWSRVSELLTVQGVQYRKAEALGWAKLVFAAERYEKPFGLIIEPEPSNERDPNALKIVGWCSSKSIHLGYVDRVEAAKMSERYPTAFLAAEFYSLYQSANDFLDVRFFIAAPKGTVAKSSTRVQTLFDYIKDELIVLEYIARADGRYGRLSGDLLNLYTSERAVDLKVTLVDDDVLDIKKWLKSQTPNVEDVAAAVDRIADIGRLSPKELWELVEIFAQLDGKITKKETRAAQEIAQLINNSFGSSP